MEKTIEELELKHILPYVPYKLKGLLSEDQTSVAPEDYTDKFKKGTIWELSGNTPDAMRPCFLEGGFPKFSWVNESFHYYFDNEVKPILRPVSDLEKDEFFDLYMDLCETLGKVQCENLIYALKEGHYYAMDVQNYHILSEWMFQHHFDWKFNLIENGLAVDINDVKNNPNNN